MKFDKVIKLIDDMVARPYKEQTTDDDKQYCEVQLATTEDKIKDSECTIAQHGSQIADTEEGIKTVQRKEGRRAVRNLRMA